MRTRNAIIAQEHVAGGIAYQLINGVPTGNSMETDGVPKVYNTSTMVDDPKGRGWKACSHTKVSDFTNPGHDDEYHGSNPSLVVKWQGPCSYWPNWGIEPRWLTPSQFTPSYPVSESSQLSDTMDSFYNAGNVEHILNVVEAPELPKSLEDLKKTTRNYFQTWKPGYIGEVSSFGNATKKFARLTSKTFLTYSFGIAPLLSDMRKTANILWNYSKEIKRHAARAGKAEVVRSQIVGTLDHPYAQGQYVSGLAYLKYSGHLLKPPTRVISVRGIRKTKYRTDAFTNIGFLAERLIGRGPFNFAWERIPFSFVVDWFVDLRSILNELDNTVFGANRSITGVLSTVEWEYRGNFVHENAPPYTDLAYNNAAMCGTHIRYYDRKVLAANPSWVGLSGRFGKKQLALSGALLTELIFSAKRR